MSIFPRFAIPGATITLHKRWIQRPPSRAVGVLRSCLRVRSPSGHSCAEFEDELDLLPWWEQPLAAPPLQHLTSRVELEPLFEAAIGRVCARLAPQGLDTAVRSALAETLALHPPDVLLEQLLLLRASQHRYHGFVTSSDAELGRYEVESWSWMDGAQVRSSTQAHEWFALERLERVAVTAEQAIIANLGPLPCRASLVQLAHHDGRALSSGHELLEVPAGGQLRIPRGPNPLLLRYAEGVGRLLLVDADTVPDRHRAVGWTSTGSEVHLHAKPGALLLATSERLSRLASGLDVTLTGEEARAWLAADSYRVSPLPDACASLVADGLLTLMSTEH